MNNFNFMGRPDGIGNRIEEIILLEAICAKENITFDYIWNNKHIHRSYEILLASNKVNIIKYIEDDNVLGKLSDFSYSFSQHELLEAAKYIKPMFNIYFYSQIKPIGIHIRGTDRIGKKHPHYMKNTKEFNSFLSKTIELLNVQKPPYIFVCADDDNCKNKFLEHLDKSISIINPICDELIPVEYKDFFALTLCSKIYMCSKFSSFSIISSLVGNIPLVSYVYDEGVSKRYKALFQYELNLENIKQAKIVRNNIWWWCKRVYFKLTRLLKGGLI